MNEYHISVLLQETINALQIQNGGKYIDATVGGGGHAREIINKGGIVLGIDIDTNALAYVKENFKFQISNFKLKLAQGNFRNIDQIAKANGFEKANGIVFDLGVSSNQFDTGERGFSFRKDAKLDMRMDRSLSVTAADLVNGLTKGELYELFSKLGEEHFARAICDNITRARKVKLIETTGELAKIAEKSYPRGFKKIHPATKIFQALRIAVNDELHSLQEALPKAVSLLQSGGRVVVISFHSLEDRIVKNYFKEAQENGLGNIITQKPIEAGEQEIEKNKRSRSAKLRIFEKI